MAEWLSKKLIPTQKKLYNLNHIYFYEERVIDKMSYQVGNLIYIGQRPWLLMTVDYPSLFTLHSQDWITVVKSKQQKSYIRENITEMNSKPASHLAYCCFSSLYFSSSPSAFDAGEKWEKKIKGNNPYSQTHSFIPKSLSPIQSQILWEGGEAFSLFFSNFSNNYIVAGEQGS